MNRRSSSRRASSSRSSSRVARRKRSIGPLLRLALPVVATALTLGALLVNTMSGGSAVTWALTGVSAVVCAGAWWLHYAASRPQRRATRRRSRTTAPAIASTGFDSTPEAPDTEYR